MSPRGGFGRLRAGVVAAARRDDLAIGEEQVRNRNRLIEQAAEIAAQIEDDSFKVRADVVHRRADLVGEIVRRAVIEAGQLDVGDVAVAPVLDGRRHDQRARDHDMDRLRRLLASDGHVNRTADRPAQAMDDLARFLADDEIAVDMGDAVVQLQPAAIGGGAGEDAGDPDQTRRIHLDRDADAAEAVAARAVVARGFLAGIARIGVEPGQGAVEDGLIEDFRRGCAQRRRVAPSGVDCRHRQLRPAPRISFVRGRVEHGDLDAFLAQLQPAAAPAHFEFGVELAEVGESGVGQVGEGDLLDIAFRDLVVGDREQARGEGRQGFAAAGLRRFAMAAAGGEEQDQGGDETAAAEPHRRRRPGFVRIEGAGVAHHPRIAAAQCQPITAPLIRGSKSRVSAKVSGTQRSACIHSGGCAVCSSISIAGIMTWPTTRMVK